MRHFIAKGRPQYKLSQLIESGITWSEYRVWRTIYEILMEEQECCWKTDSRGAEICGMNRPQYIRAIEGLVKKGMLRSLGEDQYAVMYERDANEQQSYAPLPCSSFPGDKIDRNYIRNSWNWDGCLNLLSEKARKWVNDLKDDEKQKVFNKLKEEFEEEVF